MLKGILLVVAVVLAIIGLVIAITGNPVGLLLIAIAALIGGAIAG